MQILDHKKFKADHVFLFASSNKAVSCSYDRKMSLRSKFCRQRSKLAVVKNQTLAVTKVKIYFLAYEQFKQHEFCSFASVVNVLLTII